MRHQDQMRDQSLHLKRRKDLMGLLGETRIGKLTKKTDFQNPVYKMKSDRVPMKRSTQR